MRRSFIRANSMSSNWSEEEIEIEELKKEKKKYKDFLSYFILLLGIGMIYLLMQPSSNL